MSASSRKILLVIIAVAVLGFVIYRSSGFINLAGFSGAKLWSNARNANPYYLVLSLLGIYACYGLRAARWQVFQSNLGPSNFWTIYRLTLAGFASIFLLGRAGEPIRPLLLARKERLPVADMFGLVLSRAAFRHGVHRGHRRTRVGTLRIARARAFAACGRGASTSKLEAAARTTGSILFIGVIGAVIFLVYLRLHGTAMLERRTQAWRDAGGWRAKVGGILMGFARGVQTIRTWRELALAVLYSALHWVGVALLYVWISHSLGGRLASIGFGDALLILAFTLGRLGDSVAGSRRRLASRVLPCLHSHIWSRK